MSDTRLLIANSAPCTLLAIYISYPTHTDGMLLNVFYPNKLTSLFTSDMRFLELPQYGEYKYLPKSLWLRVVLVCVQFCTYEGKFSRLKDVNNYYYHTSDSLWKIWLVESIQSIHNSLWTWHDKCNICCTYYIYHVKFNVCLVTKPFGVFFLKTKWLNASLLFLRMNYVKNV